MDEQLLVFTLELTPVLALVQADSFGLDGTLPCGLLFKTINRPNLITYECIFPSRWRLTFNYDISIPYLYP